MMRWIWLGMAAGCAGDATDADVTDANPTDSGEGGSGWTVRAHDCPGINRTDTLWVDDDGTMWIGCGSGTEGSGLYRSADDGVSWAIPDTNPGNVLVSMRVLSVHRGYGGLLYVAGEGPADSMVISLDTASEPYAATAVLTRGATVGTSFLAGPFVTTPSGAAFADSFNGSDALYRADDTVGDAATEWTQAGDWEDNGGSFQILDMVTVGEDFYGAGSTIAVPPHVFLPTQAKGQPAYAMTPVQLATGLGEWTGEMWGVAASASRVVAVGVDQDNDIGKIFVSGSDPYDSAQYTQIDVDPLLTGLPSSGSAWSRGVCMDADRVVVVGEMQPLGTGAFVLESTDGGASFTDITPAGGPASWSKCTFGPDGLVLAGAGMVAIEP